MEKEEEFNIINVQTVANNFKTKEDPRSWKRKFGTNMFGKDKP
ncbi:MAG: hypothetical protein AAB629_01290 [Patescibacteria group bacterium]|mgnify:CR=1 FL=1